jgi:hypothetical protein
VAFLFLIGSTFLFLTLFYFLTSERAFFERLLLYYRFFGGGKANNFRRVALGKGNAVCPANRKNDENFKKQPFYFNAFCSCDAYRSIRNNDFQK